MRIWLSWSEFTTEATIRPMARKDTIPSERNTSNSMGRAGTGMP